jgi:hypothetical protein
MDGIREALSANAPATLAAGGLVIGFVFGWVVNRTNFCTMGSISDLMTFGDSRRFRAWVLAAVVALVGAQALQAAGITSVRGSFYAVPTLNWLGNLAGGAMFGFGMVLAGGCASRNVARVGGGDLRALVTLMVIGVFAYMTIGGLLGPLRSVLERATAIDLTGMSASFQTQTVGTLIAPIGRWDAGTLDLAAAAAIAAAGLAYCLSGAAFRASRVHIWSGLLIGLCVVAGWALSGLAFDELAREPVAPQSLSYVRPTGDTMEWLQRFTAVPVPGFGVTSLLGALAGAFAAARLAGRFSLTTFADVADTLRNLAGAALMGVGGVMASGCTIGQALTGVSTLAVGSFLTFAAIVAGAVSALRHLERTA